MKFARVNSLLVFMAFCAFGWGKASAKSPFGVPQTDGPFRKVILDLDRDENGDGTIDDTLVDPMELEVAGDGRVFYAQRNGMIKMWNPETKTTVILAKIPVFTGLEDGMLGLALDPAFLKNGWIYLNHSLPETARDEHGKKAGVIRVSRYTLKGEELDLTTETTILETHTQREQCCHVGGSLAFDAHGNLYVSVGDNTNPFESDGYAPLDERPDRSPWDSQKSAANGNDFRGKILRVKPKPEGGYSIPQGNLFPPGTPRTAPEVYVMGCRNPFRISIDQRNGYLYWGEVGPDAGGFNA
jgi:cytochrome c